MSDFLWIAIVAAIVSAALITVLLPVLRRYALAHVNARSSHQVSTPQGAGLAVTIATIGTTLALVTPGTLEITPLGIVLAATAMIAVVGAIDDIWTLGVLPRLVLHAIAVGVVVATLPAELQVLSFLPWWLERALLLIAGIWFVNLTNFMDGIDWMTTAEFVPLNAGFVLLGVYGALPFEGIIVAVALFGALLGFAPFNRPVARIFLGDVGSLPVGLVGAWLLMLLACRGHLAAAMILPLYYVADATLTLARRVVRGEPFWQAHRTHFYQRATDRGYSVLQIVTSVFATNIVLVVLALATVFLPNALVTAAALICAAGLVAGLLFSFERGPR